MPNKLKKTFNSISNRIDLDVGQLLSHYPTQGLYSFNIQPNLYSSAVCAKHDAYVPREDVGTLEEIWPGAEVRFVDAGHVSAYILHQSLFRLVPTSHGDAVETPIGTFYFYHF